MTIKRDQSTSRQYAEGTSPLCGVIDMGGSDMKDWIKHDGGECPVDKGTLVDVQHRNGEIFRGCRAATFGPACEWEHISTAGDIIRYRVAEPVGNDTATILRQIADEIERVGVERAHEAFEWKMKGDEWNQCSPNIQDVIRQASDPDYEVRPRPRTIQIGDYTVPEPLRVAPDLGDTFYTVDLDGYEGFAMNWEGSDCDHAQLKKGVVHLDPESANQHARALIAVSGGEVGE